MSNILIACDSDRNVVRLIKESIAKNNTVLSDEELANWILDTYIRRTKNHMFLVNTCARYLKPYFDNKFGENSGVFEKFIAQCQQHDLDKFHGNEKVACYAVRSIMYNPKWKVLYESTEKAKEDFLNIHWPDHYKKNQHHPENWGKIIKSDEASDVKSYTRCSRDDFEAKFKTPEEQAIVIAEMVADWMAMGVELGDSANHWDRISNGKRFVWDDDIRDMYLDSLLALEPKKIIVEVPYPENTFTIPELKQDSSEVPEYKYEDFEIPSCEGYEPPYTENQMRKHGYSEEIITKLKNDPVHSWRMKTGIELIHIEPTKSELIRIWKNWQLMTNEMKQKSNAKCNELFYTDNKTLYEFLLPQYKTESPNKGVVKYPDKPKIKDITFPKEEIDILKKQDKIITTRVSKDFEIFQKGDFVKTPWNKIFKVIDRKEISKIEDHPYYKELTTDQINFLSKFNKIAVLTLVNESIIHSDEGLFDPVKIVDNIFYEIRNFPVDAFFRRLHKAYKTSKLEHLIQVVGIAWWASNKRSIKIHRFFIPELIFLLEKFKFPNSLIETIKSNTWITDRSNMNTKIDISRISKNMNCKLYPHQMDFINSYPINKDTRKLRGYLLSFEQGLGKTITALALMEALGKDKVVIICPKNTMIETWQKHIETFYNNPQGVHFAGFRNTPGDKRFFIFNYDRIGELDDKYYQDQFKRKTVGIIIDESHNFLRQQSLRTQALIHLAKSGIASDVLLLSGTPLKCQGVEMMPLMKTLDPFFDEIAEEIFKKSFGVNTEIAADVLNSRLHMMMTRVTKEILDLPEKREWIINIQMPTGYKYTMKSVKLAIADYIADRKEFHKKQMDTYIKEFNECIDYLKSKLGRDRDFLEYLDIIERLIKNNGQYVWGDTTITWANKYEKEVLEPMLPSDLLKKFRHSKAAVKYLHLKIRGEVLGNCLMHLRMQMTSEMLMAGDIQKLVVEAIKKTVIFTSYVDTIETCEKYFKSKNYDPLSIYGKTSDNLAALVNEFQTNADKNPLIASIQTLSTGATLTAANRLIFLNKPWRSIEYQQASDRIHRIGQDTPVDIISLVLDTGKEGNLSTRMEEVMAWSNSLFSAIVDGETSTEQITYPEDAEYGYGESNNYFSNEVMTLLTSSKEEQILTKLAKGMYNPIGQNSWQHIQQDVGNAVEIISKLQNRRLSLIEYATILFHDCSVKSHPDKTKHSLYSAQLAKPILQKTGFFTLTELNTIYQAIVEHDMDMNPECVFSSDVSDLLASADFNPPNISWILNKSYTWGITHGLNYEERIKNALARKEIYGSNGKAKYPKMYSEYHKSKILKMQKEFDALTFESCEKIIMEYRKKHGLSDTDIELPDPSTEAITVKTEKDDRGKISKSHKDLCGKYLYHGTHRDLDIQSLGIHICKNRANTDIKVPCVYMTRSIGLACLHCVPFMIGHGSKLQNYKEHFVNLEEAINSNNKIVNVEIVHNDESLEECSGERDGYIYCVKKEDCINDLYYATPKKPNNWNFVAYKQLPIDKKIKVHVKWHKKYDEAFAKKVASGYQAVEDFGPDFFEFDNVEASMEAVTPIINKKRQDIVNYICDTYDKIDPSKTNSKIFRGVVDKMSDKEFDQFMNYIKEGKYQLHIIAPNLKINLKNENILKAADSVGCQLFHRFWVDDPSTGRKFLTDNEYLVIQVPIRRQQQFLDEKIAVPDHDRTIDGMTGQVTGDSRNCSVTNPEIQILAARGLNNTLQEFVNVRGGNINNYNDFRRALEETGECNLGDLDPNSKTRVAVVGGVLLKSMMLDTNL